MEKSTVFKIIAFIAGIILVVFVLVNTKSCQRALVDLKSDFGGGIERIINVYTADGKILATYEGKIDIEKSDGGYVKFDFDGKRYIYYNCFIETIGNI